MQDIKLYNSTQERENYENLAELYSILLASEHLERSYIRDVISADEYTPACLKLIAQYKTIMNMLGREFVVQSFVDEYQINCQAALHRLVNVGVPATTEHTSSSAVNTAITKYVAEAVQHFITLMDSLKLSLVAADQIHPLLSDLMQSLNKIGTLPATFQGKGKVKEWLIILNQMRASEELSSEQVRQLLFDLESAHGEFYRCLSEK